LRGTIIGLQLDESAAEEITGRGDPGAALSTPARLLLKCNQPAAFNGVLIG
jgi:hypothetical protein